MEPQCRAALTIAPNDPTGLQWHGENLAWLGRLPEALSEARRAAALDPLSAVITGSVSQTLYVSRDFRGALNAAHESIALDSSFTPSFSTVALAEMFSGHPDSAVKYAEAARKRDPSLPGVDGVLILAYAAAGRWTDAQRVHDEIRMAHDRIQLRNRAAITGDDLDAALAFGIPANQRSAFIQRIDWKSVNANGVYSMCDPLFDSFRNDPAFLAVEHRMSAVTCPYSTPWPIKPRTRSGING